MSTYLNSFGNLCTEHQYVVSSEGKSTTCRISKDFESSGKSNSIGTLRILVRRKPKKY